LVEFGLMAVATIDKVVLVNIKMSFLILGFEVMVSRLVIIFHVYH
jgi:hypothetical protein